MFYRVAIFGILASIVSLNLPVYAEKCTPVPVVGGQGSSVTKEVSAPTIPAGPLGIGLGARAGVGLGSGALEYASTILDKLQDAGVNISDPKAVQAFLADPDKMAEARKSEIGRAHV